MKDLLNEEKIADVTLEVVIVDGTTRFWLTLCTNVQYTWNESTKQTEHSSCMLSIDQEEIICSVNLKAVLFMKCYYIKRIWIDRPFIHYSMNCSRPNSFFKHLFSNNLLQKWSTSFLANSRDNINQRIVHWQNTGA